MRCENAFYFLIHNGYFLDLLGTSVSNTEKPDHKKNIEVNCKMVLGGREGVLFQFYKCEFVLQTNRHNSYCGTLRTRGQRENRNLGWKSPQHFKY